MAKQDVVVELFYDGVWNDHSDRVYTRDPIEIGRGRGDEQPEPTPSTATLTFDNRDGMFNPRNPSSSLYGKIGRNTPIWISTSGGGSGRFVGEVSSWKPRRAIKGDAWTEVTASGVLRRLGQGASPLRSPAFREVIRQTNTGIVAYWSGEDSSGATELAAGLASHGPMRIVGGSPQLGSSDVFPGSAPCIDMGSAPTAVLHGRCPAAAGTGTLKFRMFASFPAAGLGSDQVLADLYTAPGTGTIRLWRLIYGSAFNGTLKLQGLDSTFAVVEDSGAFGFAIDGQIAMLGFEVTQDGADVDYEVATHYLQSDGTEVPGIGSGTFTVQTVGAADEVYIGPGAGLADTSIGHIIIGNSSATVDGLEQAFTGWIKETAAGRADRLCEEEDVAFTLVGTAGDSTPMGPQPVGTLTELLTECERADGGILFETRGGVGITYCTRTALYNQTPVLELDFDAGQIAPPIDPDIDDQHVRNDVTVKRSNGSSARAVQETGPLNVNDPADDPDGVGRYDTQYDVNTASDTVLPDIAGWRLHLGTTPDIRYPQVTVDLDAAPALEADTDAVNIGDLITIDNLEADLVSLMVLGYTETIGSHRRTITFNCVPASPYNVFVLDESRLDTGGSDLATAEDTTSTAWSLDVTGTALWSTTAEPYDLRVAGEVVTVTVNNDASTPQDVTVTRSVNGVVKAHAAGESIRLADPRVLAL
ncbi:hypothetical protein [Phytohabitans aurantiacus]|uniref:Minor tail protein n=1 Tax=Phytohabitans aurantiacus TaxID=3016789 RepID=A0ABQ5R274_9ACTN|nr:hypothetical protein [Phytohabitans aurantiacus]GLI00303.1 hypothetical protein Pa4123_55790 [Phytohabitans aurantiacus]